ncbi:hypothetical protein B0H11DRAFT_1959752 [Mycena galericulata]|nr:hypothetical protein B0H11DRAFT_1959752 [Mycena galericulata]
MHRALRIQEVIEIICSHISPCRRHQPSKAVLQDLARLARTCKALSEPALDALWSFQDTIIHILDCMQPDVWKRDDRSLCRPILQTDWERPLFYTRRVRFIQCGETSPGFARADLPAIFEILRYSLPTQYLFPNLSSLTWFFEKPSSFALVTLFLAPKLTRLSLGPFQSISQLALIPALAVRCPLLTDVRLLKSNAGAPEKIKAISAFVRGLVHLQSLVLDHLDAAAFEHLGHLPGLQILDLGAPQIFRSGVVNEPRFRALQCLTLRSTHPQSILAFIHAVSNSPLDSLVISVRPPPATAVMNEICAAIQHLPRSSLTVLSITTDPLPSGDAIVVERHLIEINVIRHLFPFHHLVCVSLLPSTGLDIDDDAVLAMAEAWRRLEELKLRSRIRGRPPRTTLRSLTVLAEYCPWLSSLELSIDASTIPELDWCRARIQQFNLSEWDVADSIISSALPVAAFISGIFPELGTISTATQDADSHDTGVAVVLRKLWKEVDTAFPVCCAMRDEEERWERTRSRLRRAFSEEV